MKHKTRKLNKKPNKNNITRKKGGILGYNVSEAIGTVTGLGRGFTKGLGFKTSLFNYWRFLDTKSKSGLFIVLDKNGETRLSNGTIQFNGITYQSKVLKIEGEDIGLITDEILLNSIFPKTMVDSVSFITPMKIGTVFKLKNSSLVNVAKDFNENTRKQKKGFSIRDFGEGTRTYIVVRIKTESISVGSSSVAFPMFMYYREIRRFDSNYYIGYKEYVVSAPNVSFWRRKANIGNTIQFWKQIRVFEIPFRKFVEIFEQEKSEQKIDKTIGGAGSCDECDKFLTSDKGTYMLIDETSHTTPEPSTHKSNRIVGTSDARHAVQIQIDEARAQKELALARAKTAQLETENNELRTQIATAKDEEARKRISLQEEEISATNRQQKLDELKQLEEQLSDLKKNFSDVELKLRNSQIEAENAELRARGAETLLLKSKESLGSLDNVQKNPNLDDQVKRLLDMLRKELELKDAAQLKEKLVKQKKNNNNNSGNNNNNSGNNNNNSGNNNNNSGNNNNNSGNNIKNFYRNVNFDTIVEKGRPKEVMLDYYRHIRCRVNDNEVEIGFSKNVEDKDLSGIIFVFPQLFTQQNQMYFKSFDKKDHVELTNDYITRLTSDDSIIIMIMANLLSNFISTLSNADKILKKGRVEIFKEMLYKIKEWCSQKIKNISGNCTDETKCKLVEVNFGEVDPSIIRATSLTLDKNFGYVGYNVNKNGDVIVGFSDSNSLREIPDGKSFKYGFYGLHFLFQIIGTSIIQITSYYTTLKRENGPYVDYELTEELLAKGNLDFCERMNLLLSAIKKYILPMTTLPEIVMKKKDDFQKKIESLQSTASGTIARFNRVKRLSDSIAEEELKKKQEDLKRKQEEKNIGKSRWRLEWLPVGDGNYKNVISREVKKENEINENQCNIVNYFLYSWTQQISQDKTDEELLLEEDGIINLVIYYRHLVNKKNWTISTSTMQYKYPQTPGLPLYNLDSNPNYMRSENGLFGYYELNDTEKRSRKNSLPLNTLGSNGLDCNNAYIMRNFYPMSIDEYSKILGDTINDTDEAEKEQSSITKNLSSAVTRKNKKV